MHQQTTTTITENYIKQLQQFRYPTVKCCFWWEWWEHADDGNGDGDGNGAGASDDDEIPRKLNFKSQNVLL